MSIITPSDTALGYLSQLTIGQQRFDISELSDTTGHTATRLGGPPRWTAALRTLDAMEPEVSALWKAIAVQLRGRVNHLALHDVTQPQPRGLARGTLTLASTAAAGATSLSLIGAVNTSGQSLASFETDSNADGRADGVTAYSQGTTGTVTYMRSTSPIVDGAYSQTVSATGVGTGAGDRAGFSFDFIGVLSGVSQTISAAVWVRGTVGVQATIIMQALNAAGTVVDTAQTTITMSPSFQDLVASSLVPSGSVSVRCYCYLGDSTVGVVAAFADFDALQVSLASSRTTYAGRPTLLQGDWIQVSTGVGSHYCMVTGDAQATDLGGLTVSIEPPTRKSFASATAVAWDKPKGHYKQRPDSLSWSGAAGSAMVGGFALDLMEDWTA